MRIMTWNVNSIRKRIEQLCYVLGKYAVDVALLQEIKCTNDQFPLKEIEALGYTCVINGQKSRNGVAIVSKLPIIEKANSIFSPDETDLPDVGSYSYLEARYMECEVVVGNSKVRTVCVYVPNGQEVESETFHYKLGFLKRLKAILRSLMKDNDLVIMGGDYNVAPENADVYDHNLLEDRLCFHVKERMQFRELMNCGLIDAFRAIHGADIKKFSWWNYREGAWQNDNGMRIDGLLLSPYAADKLSDCSILAEVRGFQSPSDHAPVICELNVT